jgi:hypothetical protein
MTATKAALDTYGVPMWGYEGGQGMVAPGGNTDTALQSLLDAANRRSAHDGAVYTQMLADWQASGGQTFSYYSATSASTMPSATGACDAVNQFDVTAPKWVADRQGPRPCQCWWAGC